MVCSLPRRQTEGFARSFVCLMGLSLHVPDSSTPSKRSINLELSELAQALNYYRFKWTKGLWRGQHGYTEKLLRP